MASPTKMTTNPDVVPLPVPADDIPLLYEDEEEEEMDMGESNPHTVTTMILRCGVKAHLAAQTQYQVFTNLNLYYSAKDLGAYVSPDLMVVVPPAPLPEETSSYRIGEEGPAPVLTMEVLSERSAQQSDLNKKVTVYAKLGVAEYILVDVTGRFLAQRLLLKRLQPDGTWKDEQDPDGGVTSVLGFRLIIDADGRLRVLHAATGKRYVRPEEADAAVEQAQTRVRDLEAELERLRQLLQNRPNP
jgi:Uma2 family endonuclease